MATIENLTIMFTDIVGFSDLVAKLSRLESEKLLERHDQILSKVIKRFGGNKVKSVGDSFMVTFRSPTDAVLCGMAMHDALWDDKQDEENSYPITIRVALNAGEVRLTNNDVFGDAVNIASRLEEITPPNAVYLTEAVYLSMNKSEVDLAQVDNFKFKGVREKINVYQASQKPLTHKTKAHIATDEVDYPYGGAHIHHQASHQSLQTVGKVTIFSGIILLVIFLTWWATMTYMPVPQQEKIIVEYNEPEVEVIPEEVDVLSNEFIVTNQIKQAALPLLQAKNYLGIESLITDYQEQYKDNPYLYFLTAHSDVYFKRYKKAVANYKKAFSADRSLAKSKMVAKNLMVLLEKERKLANQLIAKYLNPYLVAELSKRTGQKGVNGRYDAFYLLKDSGNASAIDRVGLNIWDLKELDQCKLKKVAVTELKRLRDERALNALQEVLDLGFFGRLKYACLRSEAKQAIALIQDKKSAQQKS